MNLAAFNPRVRYLTGLGAPPGSPSAVYRKRRLLAAFNPRVRYLTGLGQSDITAADLQALATPSGVNDIYGQAGPSETGVGVVPGTSTTYSLFTTPSTAAALTAPSFSISASTPAAAAAAASSASWFSQTNPTFGISNGMLLGGAGLLAALVLLSGGRRR